MRPVYDSLVESSRRAAEMHGASARLQTAWAERLESYGGRMPAMGSAPRFLAAVADVVGAASAAVVIWNEEHAVAAAIATDVRARAAVDVELVVGEGPAHAIASEGRPLVARAADLSAKWPAFAQATAAMPLTVIAAAPLESNGVSIGALTVFDPPWVAVEEHLAELQAVAGAVADSLTRDVVPADDGATQDVSDGLAGSSLLVGDRTAVVHQAAGMVAAQTHCDPETALALIRARAFADDVSPTSLCERIIAGELRLAV
jgi:hypothetical protein